VQDRLQAYIDQQRSEGKNPDPVELAKLRQQTRTGAAKVLNPTQLEEFLCVTLRTQNDLRRNSARFAFSTPRPTSFEKYSRDRQPQ